jgi:hypothetical protein
MVCVDYADLLAITLPYNRHHFSEVVVVTTESDVETRHLAKKYLCRTFPTDVFYRDGAIFNKWRALEEGLDWMGRHGWLCVMDADVLWPKHARMQLGQGLLHGPYRRMFPDLTLPIPPEDEWRRWPVHTNVREWAGYTQIFHADDPKLGPPPWHEVDWKHAGGADSFFQQKWPTMLKVRLSWDVLHLGPAGVNWCGRASPLVDGTTPEGSVEKMEKVRAFVRARQRGPYCYDHEKIPRT